MCVCLCLSFSFLPISLSLCLSLSLSPYVCSVIVTVLRIGDDEPSSNPG